MNCRHRHPKGGRSAAFALISCLGLLAFAPAASAAEKVTICHATGSATNPYVQITISDSAVEAHRRHQDREDIIPAPATGCPSVVPPPPPPPPSDVCPNIPGDQAEVPVGFMKDPAGNCVPEAVEPYVPCIVSVGVTQNETTVTGTPADDTIDCRAASPGKTIDGFGGNDTITGTQFDDVITGGEGNDTITGSEGNDTLSGEGGDDFVDGGDDDDTLSGGTGTNTLIGGPGTDTCDGAPC